MIEKLSGAFKFRGQLFETHEAAKLAELAHWIRERGGYTEFQAANMAAFILTNFEPLRQIVNQPEP